MNTPDELIREFDELTRRIAETTDTGVVTNWVLILETMRDDGTRLLTPYMDEEGMTPWLFRGILSEVADAFESVDYDDAEDDDEEEED